MNVEFREGDVFDYVDDLDASMFQAIVRVDRSFEIHGIVQSRTLMGFNGSKPDEKFNYPKHAFNLGRRETVLFNNFCKDLVAYDFLWVNCVPLESVFLNAISDLDIRGVFVSHISKLKGVHGIALSVVFYFDTTEDALRAKLALPNDDYMGVFCFA